MVRSEASNVIRYALLSRIVLFVLQVAFNYLIPDHKATDVFNPPDVTSKLGPADDLVEFALSGFRCWDAIYMIHIAEHGYIYEHTMAFLPVFPLAVRLVGYTALYPLHYVMTVRHVLMVAAFVLNTTCFVLAACYLYSLAALLADKGKREAWICVALFCFNPASVFMSAAYTESIFALCSFALMYYMERRQYLKATVALALACGTRSNGLVLAGYPLYHILKLMVLGSTQYNGSYMPLIRDWLKLVSCIMYGTVPFLIYQLMGYIVYCGQYNMEIDSQLVQFGRSNDYHMPSDYPNEWCYYNIPFSYGFIQHNYWRVGPFTYYQWKQLPNFLLALPVVFLSVYSICTYTIICTKSLSQRSFNLRIWLSDSDTRLLPYTVHLGFLLAYGLVNAHVQILTRMIYSSSPLICLCLSKVMLPARSWSNLPFLAKFVLIYSFLFCIIGTALHSNFLPWT